MIILYYLCIYKCNNNVMKKKKTLMIRIDDELFYKFKIIVEKNKTTMSHELRQYIFNLIKNDK